MIAVAYWFDARFPGVDDNPRNAALLAAGFGVQTHYRVAQEYVCKTVDSDELGGCTEQRRPLADQLLDGARRSSRSRCPRKPRMKLVPNESDAVPRLTLKSSEDSGGGATSVCSHWTL